MMKVIDIDNFILHVKAVANTRSYVKEAHINEARILHKKHTKAELQELVREADKLDSAEIRALFAIGLRQPARTEIGRLMIQRELKKRELNYDDSCQ